MKSFGVVALVGLLLSGCGTTLMTIEQCQSVDWFEQGKIDASAGKSFKTMDLYTRDCAKANTQPQDKKYYAGYLQGMKSFCTFDNGYERGKMNGKPHICDKDSEYIVGYNKGMGEYVEDRERRQVDELTRPQFDSSVGAPVGDTSGGPN